MNLKLMTPALEHQALFEDMMTEWKASGTKIFPGAIRYEYQEFSEFIEKLREKSLGLESGRVPSDTYLCLDEDRGINEVTEEDGNIVQRYWIENGVALRDRKSEGKEHR